MKFNIIGAGRLGKNIARALIHHEQGVLVSVCNSSLASSEEAVQQIGFGRACSQLSELAAAEVTFITTPDDCIAGITEQLAALNYLPGSIMVHCSGVLSSKQLSKKIIPEWRVASVHPLRAFRKNAVVNSIFQNCYIAVEGDATALAFLSPKFQALDATLVPINTHTKAIYHAAAVIAANYLVTLAATAVDLLEQAGISVKQARDISLNLMQSSLDNMQQAPDLATALTGPLARGDISSVHAHLNAIQDPSILAFYKAAAVATLPLTALHRDDIKVFHQLLHPLD